MFMIASAVSAQVWSPLGDGVQNNAIASTTNNNLIATAHYISSTDTSRSYSIQIWNGYYWQTLPELKMDNKGVISSLIFYKNGLYIGGSFNDVNGLDSSKNLIRWQNRMYESVPAAWRDLTSFDRIDGMNVYQGNLVINGVLKTTDKGNGLCLFNGKNKIDLPASFGTGIGGNVNSVSISGSRLVATGRFAKVNDTSSLFVASFENNRWTRLTNNFILPQKVITHKSETYLYGSELNGTNQGFYMVADSLLDTLSSNLERIDKIYDFVNWDGDLYASGIFKLQDNATEQRLIKWSNNSWQAITNGNLIGVNKLLIQNNTLVVTGFFGVFGVSSLNHVARYVPNAGILSTSMFFDKNKDCTLDKDEVLLPFALKVEPLDIILKPNDRGEIITVLPEGEYTVTVLHTKNWFVNSDCHSDNMKVNITKGAVNDSLNIAMLRDIGVRDLKIQLSSFTGNGAKNNSRNSYKLSYSNIGSQDIVSTKVVLNFGNKLSSLIATPAPDLIEGDSAIWDVTNLFVGESRNIFFSFEVKGDDGDIITLSSSIGLSDEESDKKDNTSGLSQILAPQQFEFKKYILSDPFNDTAYITEGSKHIRYQIAFANYTSDTVQNVFVIDTIKLNHNMSFIQEVESSHPYTVQVYPGAPGTDVGIVIFSFQDIDLVPNPEKSDISGNTGFITFDIGLSNNLEKGAMLSNKAYVGFDYYDPKSTNTVYAILNKTVGVPAINKQSLNVYPNPTSGILNSTVPEGKKNLTYRITSLDGRVQTSVKNYAPQISTDGLPSGLYLLEVKGETVVYRTRFIKH